MAALVVLEYVVDFFFILEKGLRIKLVRSLLEEYEYLTAGNRTTEEENEKREAYSSADDLTSPMVRMLSQKDTSFEPY